MSLVARDNPSELALGMLTPGSKLLDVARRISASGVGPVLGGVAVFLHGYHRTTEDVDVFAADTAAASEALIALGATWDADAREHVLDGVHVVGLADLIRFKLRSGLRSAARAKDLADVVELIRRVPLDKAFAGKLPTELREDYKRLVDAVAEDETDSSGSNA